MAKMKPGLKLGDADQSVNGFVHQFESVYNRSQGRDLIMTAEAEGTLDVTRHSSSSCTSVKLCKQKNAPRKEKMKNRNVCCFRPKSEIWYDRYPLRHSR